MSTEFNDGEKPLRNMSAYFIFSAEERPKLRLEFPNMSFREYAPRLSARFKALPPTEREKYNKKALLDKERFVRETLERKNALEQGILLLVHPSAKNKDHNYQKGLPGLYDKDKSETQIVEDNASPSLSSVELNICSEPLVREKVYHWYVELSQSRLYDAATKHVVYLKSRKDEIEIDRDNFMVEPGDEEVLEIRGVPSSTIPTTQYDTLPQDIQTQIKRHQDDMAQEQENWDEADYGESQGRYGVVLPPFSVTLTKHVIDEFRGLEVYQIQDIAPRCHLYDRGLWARGRSDIEVFDARTGKRLFCRLGTEPFLYATF
uniref:HMG box domain-containing protein n=1 Tax=Chaetoceros debilis TaxID=122233 RepID=A0A7S3QHQ3_9STRA